MLGSGSRGNEWLITTNQNTLHYWDCCLLVHSLSIIVSLIILSEQTPVPSACPKISGIHQHPPVSSYELLHQSLCYKHFTGCWESLLGWLQSFLWGVRLSLYVSLLQNVFTGCQLSYWSEAWDQHCFYIRIIGTYYFGISTIAGKCLSRNNVGKQPFKDEIDCYNEMFLSLTS